VFVWLIVAFLGVCLFLLRNVRDEFTINSELRVVIAGIVALMFPWSLLGILQAHNRYRYAFPYNYLLIAACEFCFLCSVGWPLLRLLRTDVTATELLQSKSQDISLEHVLGNAEAREAFREFLRGALSVENLQFYEAVAAFKLAAKQGTFERDNLLKFAKRLCEMFVVEGSEHQVNLSSRVSAGVTASLLAIEAGGGSQNARLLETVFDVAQAEVLFTMKMDCFVTF
jgi:hypothetical protein